jgi:hypothetical protein
VSGLACAIRYIKAVRGRHLSWEENVEIRGGKDRSLSQITLPVSVFRDQAAPSRSASSCAGAACASKRELI